MYAWSDFQPPPPCGSIFSKATPEFCRFSQDPNSRVYCLSELFVRVERERSKKKKLSSIHIYLQLATTKHHRKPIQRSVSWNHVKSYVTWTLAWREILRDKKSYMTWNLTLREFLRDKILRDINSWNLMWHEILRDIHFVILSWRI